MRLQGVALPPKDPLAVVQLGHRGQGGGGSWGTLLVKGTITDAEHHPTDSAQTGELCHQSHC